MAADPEALLSTVEMCRATGATYRQLDYWARTGVIRPPATVDRYGHTAEGSGFRRWWRADQIPTIRALTAVSAMATNGNGHPSKLMRAVGNDPNPSGPWVVEHDGLRITVEAVTKRRRRAV